MNLKTQKSREQSLTGSKNLNSLKRTQTARDRNKVQIQFKKHKQKLNRITKAIQGIKK